MSTTADIESLANQARQHLRNGECPQAIELFKKALDIDERRIDLHEGLATACFMCNDYDDAIKHFKRITEIDPRIAGKALINLGAVYNRLGDHNQAASFLRRGIAKHRSAEGFYNLGIAHRGLGQLAMAVSAYREAIRLSPEMSEAHLNLANVFVDMNNYQQAMIHYQAALELNPGSKRAQLGLEQAQQAGNLAKKSISPFGRLVDEKTVRGKASLKMVRALTEMERVADRQAVHRITGDMRSAVGELLELLRNSVEPALTTLNRTVTQGGAAPGAVTKAYSDYRAAIEECAELRRLVRRKVLELRAHEETINTPDLKAGK
jgi:tetratricopeptide (TPR) repeat protein